jgi:hypothetical protein
MPFSGVIKKRELLTLLIPNAFGGKINWEFGPDSELIRR